MLKHIKELSIKMKHNPIPSEPSMSQSNQFRERTVLVNFKKGLLRKFPLMKNRPFLLVSSDLKAKFPHADLILESEVKGLELTIEY